MNDSVSLYVHVPFCRAKCDYCDFFSLPCSGKIPDEYVDALLAEALWYSRFYSAEGGLSGWKTIYIGGGTPSLLSPVQLERLVSGLKNIFPKRDPLEISVEMNPETLSHDHLKVMEATGVKRLSLGIQSLNERVLKNVNRHCNVNDCLNALNLVKSVWKGVLNLDAISGLCGCSLKEFEESLNEILMYEPDHVSLYTLTVEDGTPLAHRIESGEEWDPDEADRQWLVGREMLKERGYLQYEVSNFAKPGHRCMHNMTYWKQDDYIGIGSGATGSIYDFTVRGGLRYTNTRNIRQYCDFWTGNSITGEAIPREKELLPLEIEEFEYIMMGLRTLAGINSLDYKKRFSGLKWNGDLSERLGVDDGLWHDYVKRGMAKTSGNTYSLTEKGLLFLNPFLTTL